MAWPALLLVPLCVVSMTHAQQPEGSTPSASTQQAAPSGQKTVSPVANALSASAAETSSEDAPVSTSPLWKYKGLRVDHIQFNGVEIAPDDALLGELGIQEGKPLEPDEVRDAVRRLYKTGLYRSLDVRGITSGGGDSRSITLVFAGTPRYFVGRVTVTGVKSERMISLLQYSTQLQAGTPFTAGQVDAGVSGIKQTLAQNGYNQPAIQASTSADDVNSLMNVTYAVTIGPQARVGTLTLSGDPGMTVNEFRKKAKLKQNSKVTRDTTSNALTRLRKNYQKKDRLEAAVALEQQKYSGEPRKQVDYGFHSDQGPLVKVVIEGTKISGARLKKLLPIYEESAVDNDLLNEGAHNIREFLQRKGYFDAQVDPHVEGVGTPTQIVNFVVKQGRMYRVSEVGVTGNKYFDTDTIRERMQVVKADAYVRNGRYSQALLQNDVDSITALYNANGFTHVTVDTAVKQAGDKGKYALMRVELKINEGEQQKFGDVTLTGEDKQREEQVRAMLNTIPGQPFSLNTVSADRDAVLQYYLSRGFDQAKVEVKQQPNPTDTSKTDIAFSITEGEEVFVNKVLVSGAVRTRPALINKQLLLKPGDPLDQSALVEMQRKYYDLALFNEANVAVQNPSGLMDRKNVLVQLTESKRWDVTYGAGFEAQTGQPQTNCRAQESLNGGTGCSAASKAGASFRVSADVTRINLNGSDRSLTLHTTYGLLERVATLSWNLPRFFNNDNFTGLLSGGYSNVQNISTFKASTLQGLFRVTQKIPRADTLIYDFTYRRVSVDQNSLQVTVNLIPQLSQPVRVGGPGLTWFHDTRSPSPLDAQRGMYLSVQDFFANGAFGSQTDFNRIDTTYSTYYTWGKKRKYTFARNTRIGFEIASGENPNQGTTGCLGVLLTTNASCNPVPLPERLYAGGATSHRGFAINSAGPRDLTTGFPVGGSAVFVNTFELRLPPPTLPFVGSSISFVLFHDMGNAFLHINDIWPSFGRFKQPDRSTCYDVSSTTNGTCNFAYFSHAVGLGARYGTPIGPIRVDFSYNINPTVYPIIDDYSQAQPNHAVGKSSHFNFFFSIGQSF